MIRKKREVVPYLASEKMTEILDHEENLGKLMRSVMHFIKSENKSS